jgi:hypothetical protein
LCSYDAGSDIAFVSDERFELVDSAGCCRGNVTVGGEGKLVTPRPQYSQDSRSAGRESNPERVDLRAGMQTSQLSVMSQAVFVLYKFLVAFW